MAKIKMKPESPCSRCRGKRETDYAYCRKCRAIIQRERYRKLNKDKPRIRELRDHGLRKNHPLVRHVQGAKHRAKKKGLPFNLDLWRLRVPTHCPVLGIPLDGRNIQHTATLDRVNPSMGYTQDNVQVISFRANSIKQDATLDELHKVVEYVRQHSNN